MLLVPNRGYPTRYAAPVTAVLASWSRRRWLVALGTGAATVLVIALPTALIPTPVFGREVPPTAWAWPVLLVTSVLSGRSSPPASASLAPTRMWTGPVAPECWGAAHLFFAVGFPVCNKLALLALGYTGALRGSRPIQPYLGAIGVVPLAWALRVRLRGEVACRSRPPERRRRPDRPLEVTRRSRADDDVAAQLTAPHRLEPGGSPVQTHLTVDRWPEHPEATSSP